MWELGTPAYGATTGAHSGINAWDINLTSPYTFNAFDTLYTPIYDLTGNPSAQFSYLSFWQNRNLTNASAGFRVEYTTDCGNNWLTLGFGPLDPDGSNWYDNANINFTNIPGWTGTSNGWIKSTYFLHNILVGNPANIRYRIIFLSGFGVIADGVSIDDFCMTIPPPLDAGVIFASGSAPSLPVGNNDSVQVAIRNFGSTPFSSVNIYYEANGGPVQGPYLWNAGPLNPGNFTAPFFLTGLPTYLVLQGVNNICAWTDLTGDGDHSNDTSCANPSPIGVPVIPVSYINQFCDNFDSTNLGYHYEFLPGGDPGSIWEWGTPAFGATTGAHTPPNAWDINLTTAYTLNADVALITPIFQVPANANPTISFWQNRNTEQTWDGVRVEYTTNGGTTWQVAGSQERPMAPNWYNTTLNCSGLDGWSGTSGGWQYSELRNCAFLNNSNCQLRFVFCSDASVIVDGFSIDDFCLNIPNPLTVTPTSITNNGVGFCIFPGQCVQFNSVIKNLGTTPVTSTVLTLVVDGVTVSVDTATFNPAIPLNGNSPPYAFNNCWTAQQGTHSVCVYTSLPNGSADLNPSDDSICVTVNVCDSINITNNSQYCNDFEPGSPSWVTTNAVNYSNQTSWQLGNPSLKSVLNTAHSGTNVWITKLSGNYPPNDKSALFTPLFIVNPNFSYTLSFYTTFKTEIYQDGGTVEFSKDFGVTWQVLGNNLDPNWMNSLAITSFSPTGTPLYPGWSGNDTTAWVEMHHQVCFPTPGSSLPISVIFRFRFYSDLTTQYDGWAIDDVCLVPDPNTPCTVGIMDVPTLATINLGQNFPNPFNGTTEFIYSIPDNGNVEIKITDMLEEQLMYRYQKDRYRAFTKYLLMLPILHLVFITTHWYGMTSNW